MKKEPSKTQENGISDTGIPMPDDILPELVKEKDAGKEYMAATREKLMCLLKEYLGQKYGRKVRFILPTGDPAGDLLCAGHDEKGGAQHSGQDQRVVPAGLLLHGDPSISILLQIKSIPYFS